MEEKFFLELGLTKNEGKAYDTLIKNGKMGSSEISSISGVPYSRIYDVLESLVHKGLVEIIPDKKKKFIPADPSSLLNVLDQKEKELEKTRDMVKEMQKSYEKKEKNPIIVAFGKKGFWKIVDELKKAERYSYSVKWTSDFDTQRVLSIKKRLKKGVDFKVLARYDQETKKNVDRWMKINPNNKKIENEGVAMSVTDDEEVMIGLINNNSTILIRDKSLAKIMKELFLAYYDTAEKITK